MPFLNADSLQQHHDIDRTNSTRRPDTSSRLTESSSSMKPFSMVTLDDLDDLHRECLDTNLVEQLRRQAILAQITWRLRTASHHDVPR